jgi:hypothetical protein
MTDVATPTVAQLLAQRTAAEKAIAGVELPLLQQAETLMSDPSVTDLTTQLQGLLDKIGPSNSASMMTQVVQCIASLRRTLPQDIARHKTTQALP